MKNVTLIKFKIFGFKKRTKACLGRVCLSFVLLTETKMITSSLLGVKEQQFNNANG